MKDIEAQIKDLGDITGHTLWVTLPKRISVSELDRFQVRLKKALPEGVTAICGTDEMTVKAILDDRAKK